MPSFKKNNAEIYYEEAGSGEPLITVHGLTESTLYWSLPGVTEKLSEKFRVISMDIRAHGRTKVSGIPYGFDPVTMGEDIASLADHLGIDRFHLLTHSTGGFISVRYAMKNPQRLLSLVLTNTASTTSNIKAKPESIDRFNEKFALEFENHTWDDIFKVSSANPGPFFRGITESESPAKLIKLAKEIAEVGNPDIIADFIRAFYIDPDPMIEGLRKITCPVLIIYGEKDDLFIGSSKLMAAEIQGAKLVEYKGIGHMTALESPDRLAADVIDFCGNINSRCG